MSIEEGDEVGRVKCTECEYDGSSRSVYLHARSEHNVIEPADKVTRDQIRNGLKGFHKIYLCYSKNRFFEKVQTQDGGCWGWTGCESATGYPGFRFKSENILGHVFSWLIHHGPAKDMCVLHTCRNKICTNPKHLYLGTYSDNLQDAYDNGERGSNKGMSYNQGSSHGMSKINEEDVREIRSLRDSGITQKEIADRFDISPALVRDIVKRRRWTHV